ncbi:glycosyltransferase [Synechococcales cyanobacterium C]|uniref:4,4'-diaponeurosporenoate glycosyltransferase n=1 Tax=Petrachloros mirabilis ULC683 TaxID=2781853 RepID=A0A8K1ZYL0_9CYAN|nr:TIGR04283 family arsenosugar biosynthesis glycosyltransferase [Petrachloros mirabilis]NCJ06478.1 glycosyltransferase [Petrachloros mirabilis ULC683]
MSSQVPELSVIVPVWQEGAQLQILIDHLASQAYPYELIVVDGDADQATLQHLSPYPLHFRGITAPRGRGTQMNAGVSVAQGKYLLFLHADAHLPSNGLSDLVQVLRAGAAAGAFDLGIRSSRWELKLIARVASLRSRLTRIPYGDQAIFMRREVFEAVGGYPETPIMEDVGLMQRLKRQGYAIQILRDRVQVSPRRWEQEGILYCTLRNWGLITLYFLGVSPHQLAAWYK